MILNSRFLAVAVLLLCSSAHAQFSPASPSTIRLANYRTFCVNQTIPFLQVDLVVNDQDRGLPGVIYLGVIDDSGTRPFFLGSDGWLEVTSGTIPPYSIQRQGLQNFSLSMDLSSLPQVNGRNLFIGYGALTAASSRMVQAGIDAATKMKERFPNRPVMTVEPDLHRIALVQDDMTKNSKYHFVINAANFPICDSN